MPTYNQIVFKGTGAMCTISGRTYEKNVSGFALCAYYYRTTGYTGPIVVSPTESVAHYYAHGTDVQPAGYITVNGLKWYYSSSDVFMGGNKTATGLYTVKLGSYGDGADAAQKLVEYYYELLSKLTITVSPEGKGTVSSSGTNDIPDYFVTGTDVTLTATGNFKKWSNDLTSNPYTFTITEDTSLTAYFYSGVYFKTGGVWKNASIYSKHSTWKQGKLKIKDTSWKGA